MEINQSEFREVYDRYFPMLYRQCMAYIGNQHDSKDVIQNVFVKYYIRKEPFNDNEHEKSWLLRVCANECKSALRLRAKQRHVSLNESMQLSATNEAAPSTTQEDLHILPPKLQDVMYLRYIEDYSVKEVSTILHLSQSAVKMRLKRGREQLQAHWKENHDDY